MVIMETLKNTCLPSPTPFFVDGRHGNNQIVSPPCIAWFASLRSEEVVIGKSA